jgi:hypothetical protein
MGDMTEGPEARVRIEFTWKGFAYLSRIPWVSL